MPPEVPVVVVKVYDLILWLLNQIPKFPRSHRFVLGDRIESLILELLIEVSWALGFTKLLFWG